jgi:hypothetical protein
MASTYALRIRQFRPSRRAAACASTTGSSFHSPVSRSTAGLSRRACGRAARQGRATREVAGVIVEDKPTQVVSRCASWRSARRESPIATVAQGLSICRQGHAAGDDPDRPNAAPPSDAERPVSSPPRPETFDSFPRRSGAVRVIAAIAFFLQGARPEQPPPSPANPGDPSFKPLLPTDRNESLELGMTESLISSLGRYSPRAISPLSSVRRYGRARPGRDCGGSRVGRRHGARRFVAASRRCLRVSVRCCVSPTDGSWGAELRPGIHDDLDLQDVIKKVAQALAVRWGRRVDARRSYTRILKRTRLCERPTCGRGKRNRACCKPLPSSSKPLHGTELRTGLHGSRRQLCGPVYSDTRSDEVFPRRARRSRRHCHRSSGPRGGAFGMGHIKVQYEHDWEGAAESMHAHSSSTRHWH